MQLSLALPVLTQAINNPLMASKDRSDAETLEAAKKLRNKALRLLTTREQKLELRVLVLWVVAERFLVGLRSPIPVPDGGEVVPSLHGVVERLVAAREREREEHHREETTEGLGHGYACRGELSLGRDGWLLPYRLARRGARLDTRSHAPETRMLPIGVRCCSPRKDTSTGTSTPALALRFACQRASIPSET